MKQNKFPPGWDEERMQKVIDYYENQTEDEAVAEAEEAFRNESMNDQSDSKNELNRVLEKIQEIVEKSADEDYIYRGEPQCYPKVSSGLYRQYGGDFGIEDSDIEIIQETMIVGMAKDYMDQTDESKILTELQHYGGKTNLIDFTTDFLIALFFACDGSHHEEGRVILLKKESEEYKVRVPSKAFKRSTFQKSIFIQSPKGFVVPDKVVTIPKALKYPILNHLQKYHDVSTRHIYNDIHGFIKWLGIHIDAHVEAAKGTIFQHRGDLGKSRKEKLKCYEKAIAYYSEALKLNSSLFDVYNKRGIVYNDKGKYDLAIRDYNTAIEYYPDYADAYANRGLAYNQKGNHDRAIQDYNKAIELDPESADSYNNRGLTYKKIGEADLALEDYNKAIELDPGFPEAYNNRGVVYDERGELDNAIKDYSKAIELKPYYANSYNNRGMAYSDKGDVDRAISDFSMAVGLKSDYASAYNNLGVEYSKKNQLDNALQNYSKAIEHNPNYVEAYSNRGAAYLNKGEHDKGVQNLNKAIELNPDYANAYKNRGAAYSIIGETNRAIEDYNAAIKLEPNDAETYRMRGVAYRMKGEPGKAIENYSFAIKLKSDYAEAYGARSEAWLHLKEWEKAKADLIQVKNLGIDIAAAFHNDYESIADFEQKNDIQLPEDIVMMLKQQ